MQMSPIRTNMLHCYFLFIHKGHRPNKYSRVGNSRSVRNNFHWIKKYMDPTGLSVQLSTRLPLLTVQSVHFQRPKMYDMNCTYV